MNINGIDQSMITQLYQSAGQKKQGQPIPQQLAAQRQPQPEESRESASQQSKETARRGEATESQSIDVYA